MKEVFNILCAIFCVLAVFVADAEPDEFDSYRLTATLAPFTKNEHIFFTATNTLNATAKETKTEISLPKVFPNGESNGVTIKSFNEKLLHNEEYISSSSPRPATDTEVKDMLRVNTDLKANSSLNLSPKPAAVVPDQVVKQTELIDDGENTEDKRVLDHHQASKLEGIHKIATDDISHGNIVAIFIGAIMLLAVLCYVGILSWRKFLERKYGSRQILVNEDDFSIEDPNDMRHFTI